MIEQYPKEHPARRLHRVLQQALSERLPSDETIEYVINGRALNGLVLTDCRILLIKAGLFNEYKYMDIVTVDYRGGIHPWVALRGPYLPERKPSPFENVDAPAVTWAFRPYVLAALDEDVLATRWVIDAHRAMIRASSTAEAAPPG